MAIRSNDTTTTATDAAAVVTVPDGGTNYTLGAVAVNAAGEQVTPDVGAVVAVEFRTGVNAEWEPLPGGEAISLVTPASYVTSGAIRELRFTPTSLAGAGVVGMRATVEAY